MSVTVHPTPTRVRPSARRRVAVLATGILACLLPVVFAVNLSRMLLTGELSDHRFHQLTGQGLVLVAVWLGGLDLMAHGMENRRITRELFLSDKTVRNHVSNVLAKLDAADRSDAVARARRAGLGG
jgi:hypothetical protein